MGEEEIPACDALDGEARAAEGGNEMTRKEHIQYIGAKYDFDCDAQNNALLCVIAGFLAELCDHFCGELPREPPQEDA